MDYSFENLGDERFQEFCQALINKQFVVTQSFPVGQPDGGRDLLVYLMNSPEKEFLVFQVKYVKNPYQVTEPHKWLLETVLKEVPKINNLLPKGAKEYYLLTNVRGTGHLMSGSIDQVNKALEENISIPAVCWWRDDLCRKIDADPMLKWSFPEILHGQDVLNSILFQINSENKEKRENVIKAYLADQFEIDNEVKFKQIELQNKLLDLFTDVPIRLKKYNVKTKILKDLGLPIQFERRISFSGDYSDAEDMVNYSAASLLLNPLIQRDLPRILLEGGPGQGKSTISQYVCQVHRIRLLNKSYELEKIPETHKNVPVRLPFKIDLRDVAAWVERKNPYIGLLNDDYFVSNWQKSLESFLIGHIFYHSKIENFTANDLISICRLSSILLVFDGFDESADVKVREEIIEFINKGLNRLTENSKSIQVIITSRPAAFSNSIGFSVDSYPHFELADLTSELTKEYVEKWIKSRRLGSREASEIRKLVGDKLNMPHLKDLARSPMQLAILMSLLNTRGESLPNKRTALYDSYIELFFNRESEKSSMIRDNRDLIIAIHEYLAWVLHSEAELYKNSGRIAIDDLKKRLTTYLEAQGHKTDITDRLFGVIEERVCALVSRVVGTFEFEVQPLREYFCAKYLYKTSPYSPSGAEKRGTKPERFDAIGRNFYWQNVVRFFAGCFDVGELPMLIQKLSDLQKDSLLRYTNYPRILTSQLLSDWVFTQYPNLLKSVVKIIIEGISLGKILNQEYINSSEEPIRLPVECGRTEVVEECFNQLIKFPRSDYAADLIGLINNNPFKVYEYWKEKLVNLAGEKLTMWLEYGYLLRIVHKIDDETLASIISEDDNEVVKRIQVIANGNRVDVLERDVTIKQIALSAILDVEIFFGERMNRGHSLTFLTVSYHPFLLSHFISNSNTSGNTPFLAFNNRFIHPLNESKGHERSVFDFSLNDEIDKRIKALSEAIGPTITAVNLDWHSSIDPWDILVENGRKHFGENMIFVMAAIVGAGIKSKEDTFDDYLNLHDTTVSLCKRIRCARMRSGSLKYWETQFMREDDLELTLLVFFSWATPKAMINLAELISRQVEKLSEVRYNKIVTALEKVVINSRINQTQQKYINNGMRKSTFTDTYKYLLSVRFPREARCKFIYEHLTPGFSDDLDDVLELKLNFLVDSFFVNPVQKTLDDIRKVYAKMNRIHNSPYFFRMHREPIAIPFDIAKLIMEDCNTYPRVIASSAEKSCRFFANENTTPVGLVAERDKWFADFSFNAG